MPDERRRELAREAAQGGGDAEARLLRERLRAGELTEEQVRLLADLDHAPARAALGDPPRIEKLQDWIAALPRPAVLRGCASLIRAQLERHERRPSLLAAGRQALDAVVAWADAPSPEAVASCQEAAMVGVTAFHERVASSPLERESLARWDGDAEITGPGLRALLTCVTLADAAARGAGPVGHFALQVRRAFDIGKPLLPAGQSFRQALSEELLPTFRGDCG